MADVDVRAVRFCRALTGKVLCTKVLELPCTYTGDELPRLIGIYRPFEVIVDHPHAPLVQPWHEVTISTTTITTPEDVLNVQVVLLPYKLKNARIDKGHPCGIGEEEAKNAGKRVWCCGHRRWYKEFWEFTSKNVFHHVGVFDMEWEMYQDWGRYIDAVILQYKAAQFREAHIRFGEYLIFTEPRGRWTYDGCIHSIMRRSGADRDLVEYFVHTWCDLNSEVLDELWQKISEEPFLNYFA